MMGFANLDANRRILLTIWGFTDDLLKITVSITN